MNPQNFCPSLNVKPDFLAPLGFPNPVRVLVSTPDGVGMLPIKKFKFSAGETQVRLEIPDRVGDYYDDVTIEADIHDADSFVELLLVLDSLNRHFPRRYSKGVNLILPYLPYGRQDRSCERGESFSLTVFAWTLYPLLSVGDTVTTWDAHSEVSRELFEVCKFVNIPASILISRIFEEISFFPPKDTIIVAPDKGAVGRAAQVQTEFGFERIVYATKVRNPYNGEILKTEVPDDVDYKGKNLLIVDDICDGGRTFIELAKVLRKQGPSRLDLYVTHGIFSKGFDVFENLIDHFYVANVLPNRGFYEQLPANLSYLRKAAT